MVDLTVKVPALELLVKYTASGIGAMAGPMLAPWKARKETQAQLIGVKADADSLRLIADAQAEARRSLVAPDEAGRGVLDISPNGIAQRIEFQEEKRQANIVSVVQDAAAEIGDKDVLDHEPDPDWTARFFDCVQDVTSEDMRKLWAKVLSGQVEEPGRTSLRTLDILKNMTKRDAQVFEDICDFVIDDFIYYPPEYQTNHQTLGFNNVIHLQNAGLVNSSAFLNRHLHFENEKKQILYRYQSNILRISTTLDSKKIKIPVILLTDCGTELYCVLECTFRMDYLGSLSTFLRENNCELSYARIIKELPGGQVRHTPFTPVEPMLGQLGGAAS